MLESFYNSKHLSVSGEIILLIMIKFPTEVRYGMEAVFSGMLL